ncbi:hypothetical protein IFM89_023422 [Coptis chinensis]|uniref:Protein argonaute N-terminal domain-containing protein n=1 Tax=Coptis chinensis TaxID=261450 RepID=A0A835LCG0_9MAGN|nr:hypothetical protein IFM89_023422 [Coptis chinensis]
MKDSQEKHVVSRKPLQNSMNKQNYASQPLQNCPVCLKDNKKRARNRRSRGKGKDIQVVENLKEIGVHHDLQVEPFVSSKGLMFHRRPGYGQAGTKCIVKANHFLAELPDKDLNHYHVTITPEPVVSSRRLNRAVMAQLVKLYRESDLGMRLPAYDGKNSLYTAGLLPFTSKEFSITLVDEGHNINDASLESFKGYKAADLWFTLQSSEGSNLGFFESRRREFKAMIKFVARADLQHLQQFLAGKVADTPQEALQVLDIVLRELSTQRRVS